MILDNDWSGDPDGLVALAHHLLSPTNQVLAVTSTFLHPMFGSPQSRAADGARLAAELVDLVGRPGPQPIVAAGGEKPFDEAEPSAASTTIIEVVRAADAPVAIACGGPLTNIAQALRSAPDIASRIHLLWVGGSLRAAEAEYNRDTDPDAAAMVFAVPGLRITQFPLEVYRSSVVVTAQLEADLTASGRLGVWLWRQFADLHLPDFLELAQTWVLGDSLPVIATALDETTCVFEQTSPGVRTCTSLDSQMLYEDLVAKLRLHEHGL